MRSPPSPAHARFGVGVATLLAAISLAGTASAKPFEDYLKPTPIVSPLSSASWGVAGVLPRDLSNGIESAMGAAVPPQYYYWDGEIIKAKDGKYHMFMSTWAGSTGFQNWTSSDAFHAISDTNVLGPYKRQDYVYSSHKGHNVSAVELPDGSYAVIVSEIVPFTIYKSSSLDGPWTGCSPSSQVGASNISLFPRHDGKFQIVERNGTIAIADTLCGTYVKQHPTCSYTQNATDSIYPKRTSIPGVSNPAYTWQEDPHIWRSGGTYHVIYSGSGDRVGWHVYSPDGLTWKDNGYAWSPRDYQKIFCYEGSTTCTQWYKMERPGVVLEDGHPTHITWAVADVDKDTQIPAGSNHGSKVVVVPFDGVAFDNDFGTGGSGGSAGAGGTSGRAGAGGGGAGAGGRSGTGGSGGSLGGSSARVDAGASGGASGRDAGAAGAGGSAGAGGQSAASGGTTGVAGGSIGAAGTTGGGAGTVASGGSRGGTTGGAAGAGGGTTTPGSGGAQAGGVTGAAGTQASLAGSPGAAGATSAMGGSSKGSTVNPQGSSSGCSCRVGQGARGRGEMGWALAFLLVGFRWARRRRGERRS